MPPYSDGQHKQIEESKINLIPNDSSQKICFVETYVWQFKILDGFIIACRLVSVTKIMEF